MFFKGNIIIFTMQTKYKSLMKKTTFYLYVHFIMMMLFAFAMPSCSNDDSPNVDEVENTENPRKDITLSRAEQELVNQCNDFAFRLLNTSNEALGQEEQIVFSPLSASFALSMVANGANENTLNEILTTLGFKGFSINEMNGYNQKLIKELGELDKTSILETANSVWADMSFGILDSYSKTLKEEYQAEVKTADFSSASTLKEINEWCSEKTHGRIPKFMDDLDPASKLVLLNALYFKGQWESPFKKENTQSGCFTTSTGEQKKVDFMQKNHHEYKFMTDEQIAIAELPYGNEAFSMTVVLPHENVLLDEWMKQLNTSYWAELQSKTKHQSLKLKLPKFKIEYKDLLTETLKKMGISDAFTQEADFSNLSKDDLFISEIMQANYFCIDEQGTEASAVTGTVNITSPGGTPTAIDFHVNRPFLFIIREKSTGTILFLGKINNPSF